MTTIAPRAAATALVTAVCALGLGACGSSNNSSTNASTQSTGAASAASGAAAALKAKLPAAVKNKGTLVVAADATYAPNEFIGPDGKTVQGMDADLAKALAGIIGLKADVKNATFDSIIPGLATHKYDLGMSSFTDTKEREKTVDFVTYFSAGTSFYVKAQGGPTVNTLADLCGKTVAVEKGTTQQTDAEAQSKKSNGQFKLVGQPYGTAPYGIAIPKDTHMAPVVLAGIKQLMKDGTYMKILKKWGIESGAITNPQINGAIS